MRVSERESERECDRECERVSERVRVRSKRKQAHNTDEFYKVKRNNSFDFPFCPVIIKLCAYFLLDLVLYYL